MTSSAGNPTSAFTSPQTFRIGFASRDITPPRPAALQGQMGLRVARETMDPLTVNAMAIQAGEPGSTGGDCAVIVSFDLAMISDQLQAELRTLVAQQAPDLPVEKIILAATHTHTSLVYDNNFYPPAPPEPAGSPQVMTPDECRHFLADSGAQAVVAAWNARSPSTLGRAFGHAVIGYNRRPVYADGSAQMYGKAARPDFQWIEGYEDHSVDILLAGDGHGELLGVVLVVPCPSQVDEGLSVFSADYWHEVRQELRKRLGAKLEVVGLCAPAGDQSPHFIVNGKVEEEMRRRRGLTERQVIAVKLADEVERALTHTPPLAQPAGLTHRVERLELTPRSVSKAERDWAAAERERSLPRLDITSWWPARLQQVVDTHDGKLRSDKAQVEMHVLRIGDFVLATNPFELFVDYGLRIKARSPAAQTLLVQLASGTGWYLPTARAVAGGGYGAMPAVCAVGPEGGQELVESTVKAIGELWA